MSEEAGIHDVSYSSTTQQAIHELTSTYCSGDGSKLAFQEKDGSLPPTVSLAFQLSDGDVFLAFDETFPEGKTPRRKPKSDTAPEPEPEPTA